MTAEKMFYSLSDTIAAVATPEGPGAIGVLKISGPKALAVAEKVFVPAKKKKLSRQKTFTLHYGWVADKGRKVDEVIVGIMKKPHSYTREDVVEIYSHSGPAVLHRIFSLLLKAGARPAHKGEFTYRAFVSGRIDLTQAEAVLGIVNSRTETALRLNMDSLSGRVSERIIALENKLNSLYADMEAEVSFPEEGLNIDSENVKNRLAVLIKDIEKWVKESEPALFVKDGVRCVICGRANVGKSSLFNRLVAEERVIVTAVAGTTRDVVEEAINIKGLPLRIYDTAGILKAKDLISQKAQSASEKKIAQADLVIWVLDRSRREQQEDYIIKEKIKGKNTVAVINKKDLPKKISKTFLDKVGFPKVEVSALTGEGFKDLEKTIYRTVISRGVKRDNVYLTSQRQISAVKHSLSLLKQAWEFLLQADCWDKAVFSLQQAGLYLSKVTGKDVSQEVLGNIFSKFCVGK